MVIKGYIFVVVLLTLLLGGCTSTSNLNYYGDDYSDYEDTGSEESLITSENWECTDDCSGHEAGYQWAEDEGITDPSECGGNSSSFIEGCEAYANEQIIESENYEDEEEYDYYP